MENSGTSIDVIIEVENGIAKANGRFGVGGKIEIFGENNINHVSVTL